MTLKVLAPDFDDAAKRYLAGEQTQREAAADLGLSQPAFSSRLRRNGYPAITRGEAMARRLARMTQAERSNLAAAAHDAVRGMVRTDADLLKRALGKERVGKTNRAERALQEWFSEQGVNTVPQKAIGKYNADLACPVTTIAVELFGGNWHAYGEHGARLEERTRYLFNEGWHLYIIWTRGKVHPLLPQVADDLRAFYESASRNPADRREYRVVWGDGEFIASGYSDDDDLSLVPAGIGG